MNETQTFEQPYVFGLDIGTRNVVGTVGYKEWKMIYRCGTVCHAA